jgi:hypothetical protein
MQVFLWCEKPKTNGEKGMPNKNCANGMVLKAAYTSFVDIL